MIIEKVSDLLRVSGWVNGWPKWSMSEYASSKCTKLNGPTEFHDRDMMVRNDMLELEDHKKGAIKLIPCAGIAWLLRK